MLDSSLDRLLEICEFRIDRMGREGTSCMLRKLYRIKWESSIPCRSRLRDSTDRSRRRSLSSRESVVLIIEYYIRDIEIPTA